MVERLESLLQPEAGWDAKTRAALDTPVAYFQTHRDHLHYQKIARQGAPIGSGSVESLCNQFQGRFKRTGQFWSPAGLAGLMAIDVVVRNEDDDVLWN